MYVICFVSCVYHSYYVDNSTSIKHLQALFCFILTFFIDPLRKSNNSNFEKLYGSFLIFQNLIFLLWQINRKLFLKIRIFCYAKRKSGSLRSFIFETSLGSLVVLQPILIVFLAFPLSPCYKVQCLLSLSF